MVKITKMEPVEYDVKYMRVEAGVRYWEDCKVFYKGEELTVDEDGMLNPPHLPSVPMKTGSSWLIEILVDSGFILNWPQGFSMDVGFKVCDDGVYTLLDAEKNVIDVKKYIYVPSCLSISQNGYGDYIFMKITDVGRILGWIPNFSYLKED